MASKSGETTVHFWFYYSCLTMRLMKQLSSHLAQSSLGFSRCISRMWFLLFQPTVQDLIEKLAKKFRALSNMKIHYRVHKRLVQNSNLSHV
jgi:hypothetical protein